MSVRVSSLFAAAALAGLGHRWESTVGEDGTVIFEFDDSVADDLRRHLAGTLEVPSKHFAESYVELRSVVRAVRDGSARDGKRGRYV